MRRWLIVLAWVWLCVWGTALAEPAQPTPTPVPTPASAQGQVIRLAYDDEDQTEVLQKLAADYMKTHARVTVEPVHIPTASYYTRLESLAMGSVLPDVFVIHPERIMDFVSAGALMDLSKARINYDAFPAALVALYRYNDIPYAIPRDVDSVALAYNKSMFAAAEIQPPNLTWNWQMLRDAALNLTDPEAGTWGFGAPMDGPTGFYNLIYQNGGFVYQDGMSGYNLPETQEAVQFWVNLMMIDRVSPTPEEYPDIAPAEWMTTGQVAMQFVRGTQIEDLDAASTLRDNFDIIILPVQKKRASVLEGTAFAAAANTKNPDIVLEFMAYLATAEASKTLIDETLALPAHKDARATYQERLEGLGITIRTFSDMMEYAVPLPVSPMRSVWEPLETEAIRKIYSREATVEEALDQLHEEIMALEGD